MAGPDVAMARLVRVAWFNLDNEGRPITMGYRNLNSAPYTEPAEVPISQVVRIFPGLAPHDIAVGAEVPRKPVPV